MIRLHIGDDGVTVRVLGIEVAAIHDDRTPEPKRPTTTTAIAENITSAPQTMRAVLRFIKDIRR